MPGNARVVTIEDLRTTNHDFFMANVAMACKHDVVGEKYVRIG